MDNDCDGETDEDATDGSTWYEDSGHELLLDREKEAVFGEILAFIKKG